MRHYLITVTLSALLMVGVSGCSNSSPKEATQSQGQTENAQPSATTKAVSEIDTTGISSPDGKTVVTLTARNGQLRYGVKRGDEEVLRPSRLGLRFLEGQGFDEDLIITNVATASRDEIWEQPWGEQRVMRDDHNETALTVQSKGSGQVMVVRVRAFDDGIGFRYEVGRQEGLTNVTITDEITGFNIDPQSTAWWIPSRKYNRYEYLYRKTPVVDMPIVHTPVTIVADTGTHISIHEAALVNYSGMSLEQNRDGDLEADLAPRPEGHKVVLQTPFVTPWRTIQISDDAKGLVNSSLILNLNEPNKLGDTSYFKPGKYAGIWWHQHIREVTWGSDVIHGATTERTKRLMDFAAKYDFDGVLVEGWNIGWDGDWFNNGDVFSFTETYPDFDIEAVSAYGKQIGVQLIGHHETSGNLTNYETQLEDALDLYQSTGMSVIKSGYVADGGDLKWIGDDGVARYGFHDGQRAVEHHLHVVKRAHEHRIAMNPHEPVKDTGLRRTYPNWVSREGARGQEFNAWGIPPNGPNHVPNLIFTRMLSGPMDYTPGAFNLRPNELPDVHPDLPRNDPRSRIEHTLAKELSLYVMIYSPIQMVMDLPEHYEARRDAFQFIVDVPADWERSVALDGAVGEFAVIARQERGGADWYLGALTNETAREVDIDLRFLGEGEFEAQIYRDGPEADYETNPYDLVITSQRVTQTDQLSFNLGRSGGVAIRFKKL